MDREGMGDQQRAGHHRLDDETRRLGARWVRHRPRCECGWKGPWYTSEDVAYRSWTAHVRGQREV